MGDNELMRDFGQDNDRNLFWDKESQRRGFGKSGCSITVVCKGQKSLLRYDLK